MSSKKEVLVKFATGFVMMLFGIYLFAYSQSKASEIPQQVELTSTPSKKREVETKITYCNLEVPDFWKQANAHFYLMYSFKINSEGEIVDIKKVRDDTIGEKAVRSCISNWKILGVNSKENFIALFKWRHGKGWIEQSVSGIGFKQVTHVEDIGY